MRFRMLHPHPADHTAFGGGPAAARSQRTPLLNVLLTSGGWREDAWSVAVPHILSSTGINIVHARSGVEASNVIRSVTVHIAIVDLALPLDGSSIGSSEPAGVRVLQLLRRLDAPPPTVVVRPPQATRREASRGLVDALLDGAFSVVDRPCHPETMLRIMQRIMDRHFTHSHSPHPSQEKQS
jgi:DNA-binding response OmpR family regulator